MTILLGTKMPNVKNTKLESITARKEKENITYLILKKTFYGKTSHSWGGR